MIELLRKKSHRKKRGLMQEYRVTDEHFLIFFFGLLGPQNVKISLNILDFFTRTILSPSGKKNWTLIKAKNGTHWLVKRVRIIKLKIYLTTETF